MGDKHVGQQGGDSRDKQQKHAEKGLHYSILPLEFLDEIHVRQHHFPATVSGEAEFLHNLGLLSLGYLGAVKVGPLAVGIALEFLETLLIPEPLVCQELAACKASDGNDHCTTGAID